MEVVHLVEHLEYSTRSKRITGGWQVLHGTYSPTPETILIILGTHAILVVNRRLELQRPSHPSNAVVPSKGITC